MNVYDYFAKQLGHEPADDDTLRDLPTDSECGRDCVAAIDATKALMGCLDKASGKSVTRDRVLITQCFHMVEIFWGG